MAKTKQPVVKTNKDGFVLCRVCGCSEYQPCEPPCAWVEIDICSGCVVVLKAMTEWAEGAHRPNVTALMREFTWMRNSVHSRLVRKAKAGGLR